MKKKTVVEKKQVRKLIIKLNVTRLCILQTQNRYLNKQLNV